MKGIKKTVGILLALVMMVCSALTAFAAETGSITVDNPVADQTYTAYKIFDVIYSGDKYSYTIDSTNEWFTTVQAYAETEGSGLTLTQVNGSTKYNVTTTNDFSAPDFAVALKAAVSGKTGGNTLTLSGGKATVTDLDLGYYFVTSGTGALCNLTTTNPSVTIHDKNDVPFDKEDNKVSADVGDTVTYTITGKVPDYTGFDTYTYLITDTMSEGLTFKKDVKVTVGGTDVTSACTITYDVDDNANKFKVSIPVKDNKYKIGENIIVTYSAVLNENAAGKIENNNATLKYSNDPTNSTSFGKKTDSESVYSSEIVIDKYDANDNNTKLAGAKFILYKLSGGSDMARATNVKKYYKWNNNKVEWVDNKDDATIKTTNEDGRTSFPGLADGTYYLEEIEAPKGYNLLDAPKKVDVNGSSATAENLSALTNTVEVANSTGAVLPSTGGMGTYIFYIIGGIMVTAAIVLIVSKKRMEYKK